MMILINGCHSKRTSLLDSETGDRMNLRKRVLKTMSLSGLAVKATVTIRADSGKTNLIINTIEMVLSVFVTNLLNLCLPCIKTINSIKLYNVFTVVQALDK